MTALYRVWALLRDHLRMVAAIAVAVLVAILTLGKKAKPKEVYINEKKIVDAKADARIAHIELGAEQAVQKIKEEHQEKLKALDDAQAKRAKELENDPEKLVEAILRATMVLLLCFASLLAASPAFGSDDSVAVKLPSGVEKKCSKTDPQKCAALVSEGTPAPFTGVLQTSHQAAELTAKAEFTDERIKAAADIEIRLAKNELDKQQAIFDVKLGAAAEKLKNAERALEDARPAWYQSPWFVIPVTVLATTGVIVAGAEISKKLRE